MPVLELSDDEAFWLRQVLDGDEVPSDDVAELLEGIAARLDEVPVPAKNRPTAGAKGSAPPSGLIDVSPLISPRIQNWPGDTPFSLRKLEDIHAGAGLDLGTIETSLHVGAHTDAPRHYAKSGRAAAELPLEAYYGPCQVVQVRARRGQRFTAADVAQRIDAPRVLFKTGTFPDPTAWNTDFAAPDPALIDSLAARGVQLVGFDTPSTDLYDSKGLPAHQRLLAHGMMNLEGLVLDHVAPGHYTLVALPLRIADGDASPVRAALVPR